MFRIIKIDNSVVDAEVANLRALADSKGNSRVTEAIRMASGSLRFALGEEAAQPLIDAMEKAAAEAYAPTLEAEVRKINERLSSVLAGEPQMREAVEAAGLASTPIALAINYPARAQPLIDTLMWGPAEDDAGAGHAAREAGEQLGLLLAGEPQVQEAIKAAGLAAHAPVLLSLTA